MNQNKLQYLLHAIHKNYLKIDYISKCKKLKHKTSKKEHRGCLTEFRSGKDFSNSLKKT